MHKMSVLEFVVVHLFAVSGCIMAQSSASEGAVVSLTQLAVVMLLDKLVTIVTGDLVPT